VSAPKFCSQVAFGKRHQVTGQTVARWARIGLVKLGPDRRRVDVEASEELLASRPRRGQRHGNAYVDGVAALTRAFNGEGPGREEAAPAAACGRSRPHP
jgi:hypothetical protein